MASEEADQPRRPCTIDTSKPPPWYVVGHDRAVVADVLTRNYGAREARDGLFVLPQGSLRYIGELAGCKRGTLFILWPPPDEKAPRMIKIMDAARDVGIKLADLTGHTVRVGGDRSG